MEQPSLSSSQDYIPSLHSNMYLKIHIYHVYVYVTLTLYIMPLWLLLQSLQQKL